MLQVFVNPPPGAITVPSGMVTSLTKAESSHGEVTGTTGTVARAVGVIVTVSVGLISGTGVKLGRAVAGRTAAVWAANTVCAAAVFDAAAPPDGAAVPEPQALRKTTGIRMDSAR
jgi:hypothetical protein